MTLCNISSDWFAELEVFESAPFTSSAHFDTSNHENSFGSLDLNQPMKEREKVKECQCRGVEVGAKRQFGEFLYSCLLKHICIGSPYNLFWVFTSWGRKL